MILLNCLALTKIQISKLQSHIMHRRQSVCNSNNQPCHIMALVYTTPTNKMICPISLDPHVQRWQGDQLSERIGKLYHSGSILLSSSRHHEWDWARERDWSQAIELCTSRHDMYCTTTSRGRRYRRHGRLDSAAASSEWDAVRSISSIRMRCRHKNGTNSKPSFSWSRSA